ncbi:MAG: hypothetical protein R2843_09290 [Thermomicrobiales bacterium]
MGKIEIVAGVKISRSLCATVRVEFRFAVLADRRKLTEASLLA